MGFANTPAPPATPIPVVTESTEPETTAAYNQQNNRRKGLLYSIVNRRTDPPAALPAAPAAPVANNTLG